MLRQHRRRRRGTTVAEPHTGSVRYRRALEHPALFSLDLSTGVPDPALLPHLGRALTSVTGATTPGSYLDEPVVPDLLAVLRADWPYAAEEFSITDGAMDAVDLAIQCFFRFGDRVIVEHATFPLLLDLLEAAGVEVVGVPMDGEGMLVEPLREALATPAVAVILQPRAQNPTGFSLTPSRGRALGEVLRASGTMIIEDDAAGSVASTAHVSLGEVVPEQTLHIRSFSKSHGPDLRLAALSGPHAMIGDMNARRQLGQGWSSRLLQHILLALLTDDAAVTRVAAARQEYQRRRDAVITALAEHDVVVAGNDGINLWVPVLDESAALVRLASQGIGVTPGRPFQVLPENGGYIRVTVAAVSSGAEELAGNIAVAAKAGRWTGGR
ncbi:aminotransferase class I/II-fold pyridoxal phosphate-dependent enzyme [Arthrobacter echini]|uniref:Aminotransferase class I/II-fold pyridoxal phosphate-dependent enzyme n=1 Tax=Arthrobacter echini TaxID=1529066 RepID=A0A4S5E5P2_9MICC|nr:aminotransferase class I/II-fold pyridoxal phosphate-dependent enzyme [Arthrobacter echini]THJ66818.1 aminotransferase class I/II-fold pyridoxal phosphate-dependent enzyme [Arthrobacter echini]